ncbi:hypothetical protein TNCV_3838481 [Trichonephila clavipes]|nr:hypothetical protein TNCV_3838481 [Trichonephila clavipes]
MWSVIPKSTFKELKTLKLGINIAVTQFNRSHVAKVRNLKPCDIEPSYNCVSCFKKLGDGRGSRVVQVSDRRWSCQEFQPSTTKDPPCLAAIDAR